MIILKYKNLYANKPISNKMPKTFLDPGSEGMQLYGIGMLQEDLDSRLKILAEASRNLSWNLTNPT